MHVNCDRDDTSSPLEFSLPTLILLLAMIFMLP
jgi:hypothetical protein